MKKVSIYLFVFGLTLLSCSPSAETEETESAETSDVKDEVQEEENETIKTEDETLMAKLLAFGISPKSHPEGLVAGDAAPEVTMKTADGNSISLKSLYSVKPVVVIFYRGYWCPVCNKYLSAFSERAAEIEMAGAKVVAVTPETYENSEVTRSNTGIDFTIISDADGAIMNAFDVNFDVTEAYQTKIQDKFDASIAETNASKEAVLPVPATFIIDTEGKIVYRQFDPDYKNRASVVQILKHLPE